MQNSHNALMLKKLGVVALAMFGFGYALVPMYRAICEFTGINILALGESDTPARQEAKRRVGTNSQIDFTRTITVEFDANARGPWSFKPEKSSVSVHPGEMTTIMYEFQNVQNRVMSAQAIPSYAPKQAEAHSISSSVFVSINTHWHLARKNRGQWCLSLMTRSPKM